MKSPIASKTCRMCAPSSACADRYSITTRLRRTRCMESAVRRGEGAHGVGSALCVSGPCRALEHVQQPARLLGVVGEPALSLALVALRRAAHLCHTWCMDSAVHRGEGA